LLHFHNIYLSWNPALFSSKVTVHGFWPVTRGPLEEAETTQSSDNQTNIEESDADDNVSENPQYILTMSDGAIQSKSSLWILLSRHVDKQEQEGAKVSALVTKVM